MDLAVHDIELKFNEVNFEVFVIIVAFVFMFLGCDASLRSLAVDLDPRKSIKTITRLQVCL
jgi:hypothetical protein